MNLQTLRWFLLVALVSLVAAAIPAGAQRNSTVFVVNSTADTHDSNPGDIVCADNSGNCTLRAAIEEANTTGWNGGDSIIFAVQQPAVIELSLGELSITGNVRIVGPGARRLTVQRSSAPETPFFRIFHIGRFNSFPGIATLRGMTIRKGRIEGQLYGGAILVERQSTLNLADVSIQDNFAPYGGGIGVYSGRVFINRCLFTRNTGNHNGGAIYIADFTSASATITNSTITLNSASSSGAIHGGGTLLLVNNTISHNMASMYCSSICSYPEGSVTALNNIISNDTSPTAPSISGAFISLGKNIVTDARGSSGFANGMTGDQVTENNEFDPWLGSLMDNGGQVDTRALLPGSSAINAADDCVLSGTCGLQQIRFSWDQRVAHSRRSGEKVDIGAFESSSLPDMGSWNAVFGLSLPPGRLVSSTAILTNARTGEKYYTVIRPLGHFGFSNLIKSDVYVLEIRSKRLISYPTQIVEFQ